MSSSPRRDPAPAVGSIAPGSNRAPDGLPPREPGVLGETARAVLAGSEKVSTLVRALDDALGGGLRPGLLYLVAGQLDAGVGLLPTGPVRAAVFDWERAVVYGACGPSRQDVATRVIAAHLGIDHRALRDGRLSDAERAAAADLSGRPEAALLRIDDGPGLDVSALASLCERIPDLALIVVDRLHAAPDPRRPMSGAEGVVDAVQALTHLARLRDVAVLAVLDTDDRDLLATLDTDVTVLLTNSPWEGRRACVFERDLGEVGAADFEVDTARARLTDLPPPPFNPERTFQDEEGRRVMALLVEAAGAFKDRHEELPMGLRQDLRRLVADAERTSGRWDGFGRLGVSQLGVLRDWECRPSLPATDDGRALATALDAFLDHARSHGYEPGNATSAA